MNIMIMRRGQIWLHNADPTVGDEISKIRPCVIVSNDDLGILRLKVVVPITGWNEVFVQIPWMIQIEPTQENNLRFSCTSAKVSPMLTQPGKSGT